MKKIIVTGGSGFLGSHLCEHLIKKNNYVICIDNLYSSNINNIKHLVKKKNFQFIKQDITLPFNFNADEIYNLACPASPIHYQNDPVKTIKTNVSGSLNVLDLAYETNAKVLLASTSEVYGDPLVHPQNETYWGNVNPIGVRSCYDEGKRCAETLFFDFFRQYNLKIKVTRIFNTYGPNMHINDGRVISNFVVQAIQNKPLTIYGNGEQTRSFCYVDDLINGLVKMMDSNDKITGPINLGNPYECQINYIAKKIIELSKSKSSIVNKPLPKDDPLKRKPDIRKARKLLNWEPVFSLEQGIINTINYFKNYLNLT
jgi:UDP-glucuronate decarboxylase